MTDREIIQGLIERDNRVTEEFFFVRCRPLFLSIIQKVFNNEAEYDEFVNELYIYLMEDNAVKLRNFEYRSSVYQWLKVLAIRYFIKKRNKMIEKGDNETPYDGKTFQLAEEKDTSSKGDLQRLFLRMPNQRYAFVIKCLVLDEQLPELLAKEMEISVDNLYNIKRRAMAQLTKVALNDIREYEK